MLQPISNKEKYNVQILPPVKTIIYHRIPFNATSSNKTNTRTTTNKDTDKENIHSDDTDNESESSILIPSNLHSTYLVPIMDFDYTDNFGNQGFNCNWRLDHATDIMIDYLPNISKYLDNKIILELGCGFGAPSIAAIKLGAKFVYATDNDSYLLKSIPIVFNQNKIKPNKYSFVNIIFLFCLIYLYCVDV